MEFNPTSASVETEGCDLHFWYQGTGPLLIMIPGGGGIGRQFNLLFEHLDEQFTVCTYDRRQTNASKVNENKLMNPAQQARDIIAIVTALGRQKTSIFANSGGGIIAFQFAISYPEFLDHVIAHETPTTSLLDNSTYRLDRAFQLVDTYRKHGVRAAFQAFMGEMKGYQDYVPAEVLSQEDAENFWENEYLVFTIYCPELRKIVENGVSIAVAAGLASEDAFYAVTTIHQSEILNCPRFIFPSHHSGYEAEPAAFAEKLLAALEHMEQKRQLT
ncbi:acetyltransferase/esterase [Talaromyces proteolyticus]|uniref:Acetyltransferase/esterase n=1 Tax=Talaromyces proteolyticus TaxID=1131652 RepID=A0AAD4KXL6_9EURO|nr:acetyltransferase/esterase [Talaromyces proteolyticus]KAH8703420.1 acetyltransferase/esterase [Talaromyces proteolyticus]